MPPRAPAFYVCYAAWRVVLPLTLLAASVLRVSGFSLIYFCLLLVLPAIRTPITVYSSSPLSKLIAATSLTSFLAVLAQSVFQLFLVIDAQKHSSSYGHGLTSCSTNETILRHIGLQRLDFDDLPNVFRLVLPDVLLLIVSLIVHVLSRGLAAQWCPTAGLPAAGRTRSPSKPTGKAMARLLADAVDLATFALLGLCSVLVPSATSAVYLIVFLGAAVWWSMLGHFSGRCQLVARSMLAAYMVLHMVLLYVCQAQWIAAQMAGEAEYYVRLFGVAPLVASDCDRVWAVRIVPHSWTYFVNPLALLLTYYVLVTQIRHRVENLATRRMEAEAEGTDDEQDGQRRRRGGRSRSLERQVLISSEQRASIASSSSSGSSGGGGSRGGYENLVEDSYPPYRTFDAHPEAGAPGSGACVEPAVDSLPAVSVRSPQVPASSPAAQQAAVATSTCAGNSAAPDHVDKPRRSSGSNGSRRDMLLAVLHYSKEGSYLLMFLSLMAWSVLYRSWMALPLLAIACFMWLIPNSRQAALHISPLVNLYALALIVIEYVCGINSSEGSDGSSAASHEGGALLFNYTKALNDSGIQAQSVPGEVVLSKVALASVYWLTMRQFFTERRLSRHNIDDYNGRRDSLGSSALSSSYIRELANRLLRFVGRLWMFFFSVLFLVMSIQEAYIYKMIYMVFFLCYVVTFQISFSTWKTVLRYFLWLVALYSIAVVVAVYTLSFNNVLLNLISVSGVSTTLLQDMGFVVKEDASASDLLNRLIVPAVFLIAIMLQLHVFHDAFLRSVSTDTGTSWFDTTASSTLHATDTPQVHQRGQHDSAGNFSAAGSEEGCCAAFSGFVGRGLKKLWPLLVDFVNAFLVFVDCHMTKVVAIVVASVAVKEPSALNFVLMLIVCTFMHTPRSAKIMVVACQLWVGLAVLAKMAYKLGTVRDELLKGNCSSNITVDTAQWLGVDKAAVLPSYLTGEICIIVTVCIAAIVRTRQDLHFSTVGSVRPHPGQIFPDVSLEAAESSLAKLFQFTLNYGYQTLGLEISCATSVIVVASRQDGMALLYAVLLAVMMLLAAHGRRTCAKVWPFYLVLLVVLLPAQYLAAIGLPPSLCAQYPWEISNVGLQRWLYLPSDDGVRSLNASLLIGDFFQLLVVSLQQQVFSRELRVRVTATSSSAGTTAVEGEAGGCCCVAASCDGELHDFIDNRRNIVDVLKNIIFVYWFIGTLVIMFVTGTVNINLFCFGYVITSFYFLWFGDDFLQKPKFTLLRSWHLAMGYNFTVIVVKLIMQLIGCAMPFALNMPLSETPNCVVAQLLSITCLSEGYPSSDAIAQCGVPQSAASFTWDVVCFVALLIQRRIFISRYFVLTVIEIKTENKLASSGAKLINQLLASRRKRRKEAEEKNLEALQRKVERIQLRQLRLQQGRACFDEHYKVIRSGGAYMFEDDSDEDELTSTTDGNTISADDPVEGGGDYVSAGVDPLSLVTIAMNQGVKSSLATAARAHQHQQHEQHDMPEQQDRLEKHHSDAAAVAQPSQTGRPAGADAEPTDEAAGIAEVGRPYSADTAVVVSLPAPDSKEAGDRYLEPALNDPNTEFHVKDASWETTKDVARLSKTVCESLADYITAKLLIISKDYRIVARQMQQERKRVKAVLKKLWDLVADPSPAAAASQPLVNIEASTDSSQATASSAFLDVREPEQVPSSPTKLEQEITAEDGLLEGSMRVSPDPAAGGTTSSGSGDANLARSSRLYRLISVFCVAIISRTEFLCYFTMILSHLCSGSVLTMPLPVLAFLWGQLSMPRPAKTFWVVVLTYVMITVLIKYFCQFSFNTWNDQVTVEVFQPARIIGLMKSGDYAAFDILVLVCLFLHRSALRKYGLWKNASELKYDLARAKSAVRTWQHGRSLGAATLTAVIEPPPAESATPATERSPDVSRPVDFAVDGTVTTSSGNADLQYTASDESAAVGSLGGLRQRLADWASGLVGRDHNASLDVYPYIFFCDFVNFVIVVFFYWSFGPTAGNVTSYLRDNRIPWPFLIQLLLQFVLIVIDRALYLRRNAFGKFVFQVVLVIVVHIWMFFLLPYITQLPFTSNKPAQVWYFIKCIYFWLSAYQIRAGYPINTIAGSFFRTHNYLSWTLLALARAVPFLMEMRIAMDWIWTESCLSLGHWFTMEDVYVNVFSMKCLRDMELKYPTPRGHNRRAGTKYGWGGFVLFGLAFIVWFPLLLFSFANAVYTPNAPVECTLTLTVGGYQPLFTAIAQGDGVATVTKNDYYMLKDTYKNSKEASSFLENYDERDVRLITFRGDSTAVWAISPPDRESLLDDVCENSTLSVTAHVTFTRPSADGVVARIIKGEFFQQLLPNSTVRNDLCNQLKTSTGSSTTTTVVIPKLFPRFITVPASGTPSASPLMWPSGPLPFSNVTLTLNSSSLSSCVPCNASNTWWWKVQENTSYPYVFNGSDFEMKTKVQDLSIVAISNRVAPAGFSFLTGYGVIGLYVSIVFVIGRFLRIFTSGQHRTIMFDELPNVDKILKLCHNVYFARQLKKFRLEEDLFAKLIFLYRSPDVLMRWTKVKVA